MVEDAMLSKITIFYGRDENLLPGFMENDECRRNG